MKTIMLTLLYSLICLTTSGQTICLSNNRYRGSDVLEKKQIVVKGFSLNDTKSVWSLEEAEISEGSFDSEYTMETDTVMAVEQGNRTYYSQDRGSVSIIAHETYNFQARNIPLIKAHLNASGIENLMTGSYIDPLQRNIKANGLSSIPIRSKNGNKIIHTINIYTVNGNVKKVSR